uniref:Uncharacterized protein n=1 Tax=viral metagenome TaxID=1070528 RepID=A0A6H1ZG39_9ZZZZ
MAKDINVTGVKIFTSHPKISSYAAPTADAEYAPKKYVDDSIPLGHLLGDASETEGPGTAPDVTIAGGDFAYGLGTMSGQTLTMARDLYCRNLTINSGYTLKPNGFKIFCTGTLLNNGTIERWGNAGSAGAVGEAEGGGGLGGAGGTALAAGTLPGALAGVVGQEGGQTYGADNGGAAVAGINGVAVTHSILSGTAKVGGTAGGGGGNAAAGVPGASANPGTAGSITSVDENANFHDLHGLLYKGLEQDAATLYFVTLASSNGGAAGGGGGANTDPGTLGPNGGGGGGGGGNAGLIMILCKTFTNNATITTNGGAGGIGGAGGAGGASGGGGGGGGGAGGNGGYVLIVYDSKTASGTIVANGGAAGAGGAGGTGNDAGVNGGAGQAGLAGTVLEIEIN